MVDQCRYTPPAALVSPLVLHRNVLKYTCLQSSGHCAFSSLMLTPSLITPAPLALGAGL
jgi:hypothetical protein